jgi:hypothetical protein
VAGVRAALAAARSGNRAAVWHPALPPAEIENGPADRVGRVRVFPLAGGHREILTGLDDQQRSITLTFGDNAGLPVRSYRSTITARPVTQTGHTYVEWSSRFDCDEADEDKVIAGVRDGVLVPGLKALEQRFGPGPSAP